MTKKFNKFIEKLTDYIAYTMAIILVAVSFGSIIYMTYLCITNI